jgi:hypothetical protein
MKHVLMLFLVTATSFSQTKSSQQIFKSPDGTFMFRYRAPLILCQAQYQGRDFSGPTDARSSMVINDWEPIDSCVCPLAPDAAACVAYPHAAYEGTWFNGGAFSVTVVPDITTKDDCLQFNSGTVLKKTIHSTRIGGVKFKAGEEAEGWTSHGMASSVYLAFHNDRCYRAEIRTVYTTSTCCDAEDYKKMEFKDEAKVNRTLRRVLDSLRFLK